MAPNRDDGARTPGASNAQPLVDAHAADTTDVHGIADTGALETQAGAQQKVDTHAAGVGHPSAAPGASAPGDTPDAGAADAVALADHRHGREPFGAVTAASHGDTAANGVATAVARADHNHGLPNHAGRHRGGGPDSLFTTARVATGTILPTATVGLNVTWAIPFANPNYTVVDHVSGGAGNLETWSSSTKLATGLTQVVHNNSATDALSGTLELLATADA